MRFHVVVESAYYSWDVVEKASTGIKRKIAYEPVKGPMN